MRWNDSMNSIFHFFQVSRYTSRDSFTDSYFSVSTSQTIFFRSSERGGARWSEAKFIALSRFEVCLMYVTVKNMQSTIWLLAFILQLFAINSGSLRRGIMSTAP